MCGQNNNIFRAGQLQYHRRRPLWRRWRRATWNRKGGKTVVVAAAEVVGAGTSGGYKNPMLLMHG